MNVMISAVGAVAEIMERVYAMIRSGKQTYHASSIAILVQTLH